MPAEQVLRDMRINRIFEGSTEIMHLLIAREAIDQHLSVAGDIIDPEADLQAKGQAAVPRRGVLRELAAEAGGRQGQVPGAYDEFGELARHLRYVERQLAQARSLDVLRDEPLAGARSSTSRRSSAGSSTSAPSCSRCRRRS